MVTTDTSLRLEICILIFFFLIFNKQKKIDLTRETLRCKFFVILFFFYFGKATKRYDYSKVFYISQVKHGNHEFLELVFSKQTQ